MEIKVKNSELGHLSIILDVLCCPYRTNTTKWDFLLTLSGVVAYNYLMNYIEIHSYLSSLALSTWPEFLFLIPSLMMKTDQKKKKCKLYSWADLSIPSSGLVLIFPWRLIKIRREHSYLEKGEEWVKKKKKLKRKKIRDNPAMEHLLPSDCAYGIK